MKNQHWFQHKRISIPALFYFYWHI